MTYVLLATIIISTGVTAYAIYMVRSLSLVVTVIIQDAIAKELRLQDDRITKRMTRAEGPSTDEPQTRTDGVIGQPYRRS